MNPRNTRIFQKAVELVRLSAELSARCGSAHLRDQIDRAADSVCANFVEGCGRRTPKDRRRFFDIAKGSAYEVSAWASVAVARGLVEEGEIETILDVTDHLGAMLYRFR